MADLQRQVAEAEASRGGCSTAGAGSRCRADPVGQPGIIAANLAFWMRGTVLNTNRWVNTVGPLTQNEVIVNTLTGYVVAEVFEAVNVQQVAQDLLPERAAFLSGPLTGALQDAVRDAVSEVVRSDQVNAVWIAVNRTAHKFVIGVCAAVEICCTCEAANSRWT